ncbi:hypothetical protein K440DRAFT_646190, partial [Wilcoxina mikolae CBS 423.85]
PFSISQDNLVGTGCHHRIPAVFIYILVGHAGRRFRELPLAAWVSSVSGLPYLKNACMVIQNVFVLVSHQNEGFDLTKQSVLPIAPLSLEVPVFLSIRNINHKRCPSPNTTSDSSVRCIRRVPGSIHFRRDSNWVAYAHGVQSELRRDKLGPNPFWSKQSVVLNLMEPMMIRNLLVVPNELKRAIGVYLDGEEEVAQAEPFRIKVKERFAVMFCDLHVNSREGVVWHK